MGAEAEENGLQAKQYCDGEETRSTQGELTCLLEHKRPRRRRRNRNCLPNSDRSCSSPCLASSSSLHRRRNAIKGRRSRGSTRRRLRGRRWLFRPQELKQTLVRRGRGLRVTGSVPVRSTSIMTRWSRGRFKPPRDLCIISFSSKSCRNLAKRRRGRGISAPRVRGSHKV